MLVYKFTIINAKKKNCSSLSSGKHYLLIFKKTGLWLYSRLYLTNFSSYFIKFAKKLL